MASPSICYRAKCFGCKNLFEKSSILRCLHSICSKCVESLCKASELKCPICGVVSNMNEIVCDYSMPIWMNIYMKSNLKAPLMHPPEQFHNINDLPSLPQLCLDENMSIDIQPSAPTLEGFDDVCTSLRDYETSLHRSFQLQYD